MKPHCARACVEWLLLLSLLLPGAAGAQTRNGAAAAEVQAAYLLNFLRFTHWPPTPAAPDAPLDVVVLGAEPLAEALRALLRQPGASGLQPVRVHALQEIGSARAQRTLQEAEAVFVGRQDTALPARVLRELRGRPVLTVGEGADFARNGGMLGLVPEGTRIVFDANPHVIHASGLQLSAKVLKLARIVEEAPNG